MKLFIFLSEILGRRVLGSDGQDAGRLCDIPLRLTDETYPRADGIVVRRGLWKRQYAHIPQEQVADIQLDLTLKIPAGQVPFQRSRLKYDFTLCNDVLDRQVVDVDDQKVVRVNDVHLLKVDNQFYLAHVDVGARALVRRLGWTPAVDFLVRLFRPRSPYLTREAFIAWKNTQVLTSGRYKNVLRLSVSRQKLSQIPPTELAEIMENLDIFERLSLFKSLDEEIQRKVFADLATQEKQDLLDQLEDHEAVSLLENIPRDEATDALISMPKPIALRLMRQMQTGPSKQLRKLLGFAKDSAGGLMTTEYLSLQRESTVADAIALVKEHVEYPGNIYHIYIVDDAHHLVGLTSLRRFINVDPSLPVMDTCYPKIVCVKTDDGMEEIALLLEKYKFSAIPVVDEDNVLQGAVTTDDVMEELIALAWAKYKEKLT